MAEDLDCEARNIEEALDNWSAQFPDEWSSWEHTLSCPYPLPSKDFYSSVVFNYSTPAYAAPWNTYYATKMLINSTRLKIFTFLHPDSGLPACKQRCISHIKNMANHLASSLPFCLQKFKIVDAPTSSSNEFLMLNTYEEIKPYMAGLTVWPLGIASGLRDVDCEQRAWFRDTLTRLGKMTGDQVIESVDTDGWFDFDEYSKDMEHKPAAPRLEGLAAM
ncbi:hypothetical protein LSUE1_G002269 [Lachnellula suecica]|uniref:Uncharacterized protein n=1 Tax=Lachnellula suecica TaxID=602035 RepID=A0A8T9CEG0_9HELO|nr:hypothetical protein LSUE1_G002269 [Lachnellula suecica]